MGNLKAILFDLDGTLVDSVPTILKAARVTFEKMGIDYDEDAMRKTIGQPIRVQASMFAGERASEFIHIYREAYREFQNAPLFRGTSEMLTALKKRGYKTGVVTSKVSSSAKKALEACGLWDKLDIFVSSDDVLHPKPHPESIIKALELLSISSNEAVYVGDSTFDIDAAQGANVIAAAVSWGARSRADMDLLCPGMVFDDWDTFLTWVDDKS